MADYQLIGLFTAHHPEYKSPISTPTQKSPTQPGLVSHISTIYVCFAPTLTQVKR
ncbi:uncharacterized protein EURHEDRAFT_279543 [Aspergillus ruber CBS 135680]|uniref:Uncharacterized protein n=1 Tax=Aspergillus ruber (strain CBS 135680) TaxID=1388766 RepID=A0A017S1K3_ASPRC|nr:uncharacterized protein EURHEDRAFT_279543 [Aspergillus ruber CBS 135680]EYE90832.1 hypothetical protein EURHEDRAFT_279543 [Aspergillus ruber CBS 135680]